MRLPPELNYLQPRVYPDLARIGSVGDGGYLVPRSALSELDAVLSFGVSVDWNFEKQLRDVRPGVDIHCYDHTVSAWLFAKFFAKGIVNVLQGRGHFSQIVRRAGVWRDYPRFFRERTVHFRERVFNREDHEDDATIERIFARIPGRRHVLVKCDIEGGEYRIIPGLLRFAHLRQGVEHDARAAGLARRADGGFSQRAAQALAAMRVAHVKPLHFRRARGEEAQRHAAAVIVGEKKPVVAGQCVELALEADEAARLVHDSRIFREQLAHHGDLRRAGSFHQPGHINFLHAPAPAQGRL